MAPDAEDEATMGGAREEEASSETKDLAPRCGDGCAYSVARVCALSQRFDPARALARADPWETLLRRGCGARARAAPAGNSPWPCLAWCRQGGLFDED